MKTINVKCPVCGTVNHNLYLEETEGWMECECCGTLTKDASFKKNRLPKLQIQDGSAAISSPAVAGVA